MIWLPGRFLVIYNSELNFINSYVFPAEEMSPAMLHVSKVK